MPLRGVVFFLQESIFKITFLKIVQLPLMADRFFYFGLSNHLQLDLWECVN